MVKKTRALSMFITFLLVLSILYILNPNYIKQISKVYSEPDLPVPEHEWLFDGNLSDTGSATVKYDLVANGTPLYTSDNDYTPPSNLYGQSLNNSAGNIWLRNESFFDNINTEYGSTGFTIELWFMNTGIANYRFLLYKQTKASPSNYFWIRCESSSTLRIKFSVDGVRTEDLVTVTGPWVHLVVMMAPNGTIFIYANYNQAVVKDTSLAGFLADTDGTSSNFTVMSYEDGLNIANSYISCLRVYKGLLTEDQVYELYWNGIKPPSTGNWSGWSYLYMVNKVATVNNGEMVVPRYFKIYMVNSTLEFKTGYELIHGLHDDWIIYQGTWHINNSIIRNLNSNTIINRSGYIGGTYLVVVNSIIDGVNLFGDFRGDDLYVYNVTIRRTTIGFGLRTGGYIHRFENVTIYNYTIDGLILAGTDNAIIRDVKIYHFLTNIGDRSVAIGDISNNPAENNTLINLYIVGQGIVAPHHGIYFYGYAYNNTVRDSYISTTGNGIFLAIYEGSYNYVINCTFVNNSDGVDGGTHSGTGNFYGDMYIINSTFVGTTDWQISLEGDKVFHFNNCTFNNIRGNLIKIWAGKATTYNTRISSFNNVRNDESGSPKIGYWLQIWNFSNGIIVSLNMTNTTNIYSLLLNTTWDKANGLYIWTYAPIGNVTYLNITIPWKDGYTYLFFDNGTIINRTKNVFMLGITHNNNLEKIRLIHGISLGDIIINIPNTDTNITRINIDKRILYITLVASSGADSESVIYTGNYGVPSGVYGNNRVLRRVYSLHGLDGSTDCWFYDPDNKLLYIKVRHHSPVTIKIDWTPIKKKTSSGVDINTPSLSLLDLYRENLLAFVKAYQLYILAIVFILIIAVLALSRRETRYTIE